MIRPIEIKDYSVYAPGQYVIIEQYFQSGKSLAGKDMFIGVKFDEYEDCEDEKPSGLIAFKMPFGAGTIDIPISNKKLTVEAIDDKTFKVIYEFMNTGSTSNSSGCATSSTSDTLGIAVGYDEKIELTQIQKDQDPCRVSNTCWIGTCANIGMQEAGLQESPVIKYFDDAGEALNGYNLNGGTILRFEIPGAIGHTYYLSFCSSYAQINDGVSQVGDMSTGTITGGKGFQTRDGSKAYATAELSLIAGSTGYLVYSNGCSWQAAKFSLVPNTLDNSEPPIYPPTYGDVACQLTVNETVVTDCCIGVYPGQNVNVRLEMDTDQYNSNIIANDTYGTYASNFKSVGLCISETPVSPDMDCSTGVNHSAGVLTTSISVDSAWAGKPIYLNYQWRFQINTPDGSYEDVINKVVLLNVGTETAITLTDFRDELGVLITGTYCLDENMVIKANISGESGQDFAIFAEGLAITPASGTFGAGDTELTIQTEGLEPFGTYCFEVEGEGDVDDSGGNPADCASGCTQIDVSLNITDTGESGWVGLITAAATGVNISSISINGELTSGSSGNFEYQGSGNPAIATANLLIGVITSDGCVYYASGFIEAENKLGASNSGFGDCSSIEVPFEIADCESNNPGIGMTCSAGSMTISKSGTVANSTSDDLNFSGGGLASSDRFDLATRVIATSDCGTITIYECFNCEAEPDWDQIEECEDNNEISVTWEYADPTLTLTSEGTPTSPVTDIKEYSLDGGANWLTYSTPVTIAADVTDIPIRRTATFAICDDAVFEDMIVLPGSPNECLSNPELGVNYDELTDKHSATKQGSVYNVLSDDVYFSADLGDTFEPYTGPVTANFAIFMRITIFKNDCETITVIKGSTKPAGMCCPDFKAYIESVIPGASSYTLNAGIIAAPSAVSIEWFQYTSGSYVSIGTGNSVTTTQVGHIKMVATTDECTREDYTEVAMDFVDKWYYQKFVLTGGEDHVTVTAFTLPDIVNNHPDRIAWLMQMVEDGVTQRYEHEVAPASLDRQAYSIDGQDVQFNPAYVRAGRIIVVKMKKV